MRAGRVLLASAIVHAALFGALSRITVEGKRVPPVVAPTVGLTEPSSAPTEPAVFDVIVLDSSSDSRTTSMPSPSTSPLPSPSGSMTTSTTHATTTASPGNANIAATTTAPEPEGHGQGQGHGQGMMRMRGPDLGLAPGTGERIAATGRPLPAEPKVSGQLHSAPGGRAISDDAVTTMTVEQDGSVTFADKPDIDIKLKLPIPRLSVEGIRKDLGTLLTDWYRDPDANKKFGRKSEVSRVILAVPGSCDSWGDVWCDDPSAPRQEQYQREQAKTGAGSIFGGKMDITAYLHRKFIGDPYSSRKLKLLDDTRDERVAMGTKFKTQQLARAGEIAMKNLARIQGLSLAAKKQALFELWDECSEGDDAEGQAGQRVRALVLGFIRTHLPEGSPSAYTPAEIAALHAKRSSKQAFAPYQAESEELELHETAVPDEH